MPETDGRRWVDFEVGDRSEAYLQRLYARLPEAELYRSEAYVVHESWLPPDYYVAGKGGAVNRTRALHSWLGSKLSRLVRQLCRSLSGAVILLRIGSRWVTRALQLCRSLSGAVIGRRHCLYAGA